MSNRYVTFDDRAVLEVSGADARNFLQGLITQDVNVISNLYTGYSALLTAQGKFLADFFLIHRDAETLWLECAKTYAPTLLRLFGLYRLRADVKLHDHTDKLHVHAVFGNVAQLALFEAAGRTEHFHQDNIIAFIDPRSVKLGARVIAPVGEGETWLTQRGFAHAALADYDHRRLALGIPAEGDNLADKTLILENGFEALHGVSFNKGCYVGQEVTARTKHRANLHKLLFIVEGESSLPESGTPILLGEREVGQMRSSRGNIGLAVLRVDSADKDGLTAGEVVITAKAPEWRG